MDNVELTVKNTVIILNSSKTIFIKDHNLLLLTDLHLGKTTHFRKNGIAIPSLAKNRDITRLESILEHHPPTHVVFLGDLFHSELNSEWNELLKVLKKNAQHEYTLVEGNHDVLHRYEYHEAGINCVEQQMIVDQLVLSHEPIMELEEHYFNICGHIHPGISIKGKGHASVSLPCFHFDHNRLIMPSFGQLTGLSILPISKRGKAFGIYDNRLIAVEENY